MSKRRSRTSPLLDAADALPVILLDENLSSPDIVEELRRWEDDWQVELHRTHFPNPRTPDPEVLAFCGSRGWILVSVDDSMRRNPTNVQAAEAHGARVFCFPKSFTSGAEYRASLTAGRHKLLRVAKKMPPPYFARITKEGNVGFFERDRLPAHATSREKTAAKYGAKVFDKGTAV